jgi:hypothetical protein
MQICYRIITWLLLELFLTSRDQDAVCQTRQRCQAADGEVGIRIGRSASGTSRKQASWLLRQGTPNVQKREGISWFDPSETFIGSANLKHTSNTFVIRLRLPPLDHDAAPDTSMVKDMPVWLP